MRREIKAVTPYLLPKEQRGRLWTDGQPRNRGEDQGQAHRQ